MMNYSKTWRNEKRKSNERLIGRIAIMMVLLLVLASAISIYMKQDQEMERLARESRRLDRELQQLKAEELDLKELSELAGTEEFLERMARDELGLVKADELIFIE